MRGEWLWTPTQAFLSMLRALPGKEEHQVLEKLKILELDPSPDGKAKKSDVHESLKFQGRTSVLRTVYRSTYEIGQATQSYLSTGILDDEPVEYKYLHNGPLPVVREVIGDEEEVQLLMQFMHGAAHDLRFSLGSCAVLMVLGFVPVEITVGFLKIWADSGRAATKLATISRQ